MDDDFSLCMLNNARRAARAVSRRYDRLVRSFGLKAAQFSVLTLVMEGKGQTTGELAALISMERTTLVRNLALLERKGLVTARSAESSNAKTFELTPAGRRLMDEALPVWRQAQAELEAELGTPAWETTLDALKRLSRV